MKPMVRLLAVCSGLLITGSAAAQSAATSATAHYPNHPVRLLVGFTAAGPTDVIARIVAQKLSASLGQQFYVDNRPGAGSNIASAEVAKAAPDGYTILVVSTGFMVNMSLYAKVPYDAVKDFTPITMVAYSPNVLAINPSVPVKSVKELVELIKASPGKFSFAGTGIGSTPHLSGELFKQKLDVDIVHVPFPGAAPAVSSTIAGHT
jgi:tripartite-type tricarboxylate transporter receptor subunit TctC